MMKLRAMILRLRRPRTGGVMANPNMMTKTIQRMAAVEATAAAIIL